MSLAPFQTRLVALDLQQLRPLARSSHSFHRLHLILRLSQGLRTFNLSTTLNLPISASAPTNPRAFLSTFLSNTLSPTYALYTPPSTISCSPFALLALHGAGVDPASSPSWTSSFPAREEEWIVWPLGLTEWGYDWHAGSLVVSRVLSAFVALS